MKIIETNANVNDFEGKVSNVSSIFLYGISLLLLHFSYNRMNRFI